VISCMNMHRTAVKGYWVQPIQFTFLYFLSRTGIANKDGTYSQDNNIRCSVFVYLRKVYLFEASVPASGKRQPVRTSFCNIRISVASTMDARLPFKKTRLATAHKVHSLASKVGSFKLADAIELGIRRIEREMAPKECNKCTKLNKNTDKKTKLRASHNETLGHDPRNGASSTHNDDGDEDDGLAYGSDVDLIDSRHSLIPRLINLHSSESRPRRKEP
jgi:hypothetical protein